MIKFICCVKRHKHARKRDNDFRMEKYDIDICIYRQIITDPDSITIKKQKLESRVYKFIFIKNWIDYDDLKDVAYAA